MRPQLFAAGVLAALLGVGLYVLEIPLVFFWSIPLGVGGAIMAGASLLLPESQGPVEPPDGYRFCAFCSSPVGIEEKRCPNCNGVQQGGDVQ